ncbi:MAG: hypothetical protein L6420_08460 [Elusimicrobia bacterium]|nr:hypothetical protein [Elusimicrobiota bacterium]
MHYKLFLNTTIIYFFLFCNFSTNAFAIADLESKRQDASILFDGSAPAFEDLAIAKSDLKYSRQDYISQLRQIMSAGVWNGSTPAMRHFQFKHGEEGWNAQSQSVGLEGFLWSKKELEDKYGADKFIHQLDGYFTYLDHLLAPVAWTKELRDALTNLKNSDLNVYEKNDRLNLMLENYIEGLQENMEQYDSAGWIKKARIYELFPRAYNTAGRRGVAGFKSPANSGKTLFFKDFAISDFDVIKRMGFDVVWPMGILPIGKRGQTGAGGGSPYSISDHSTVNPDLGTEEDFKNFVKKAHMAGLRVMVDFVVNHTSLDSKLLHEDPDYFLNFRYDGVCPRDGYFEHYFKGRKYCVNNGGFEYGGGVSTWIDTAQVNYSNEKLRSRMTQILKGWVSKFDIDGFRVDMAHLDLNNVFSQTWHKSMPYEEFYMPMIREVKSIKASVAFIAEAYSFQEDLSACGFDAIYSKYETGRPEGQTGWYETSAGGNSYKIGSSINRVAFLAWQNGGAGAVVFIGNHDEPAPETVYGKRLPAALIMTMLMPSSVMVYSGAEIGYNAAIPTEHKPLPFSVPTKIDWSSGDSRVKETYQNAFSISNKIRSEMGDYDIKPLWPRDSGYWSGYVMISKTNPNLKKAVIGNITWNSAAVNIPEYQISLTLEPGEYKIINLSR